MAVDENVDQRKITIYAVGTAQRYEVMECISRYTTRSPAAYNSACSVRPQAQSVVYSYTFFSTSHGERDKGSCFAHELYGRSGVELNRRVVYLQR